MENLRKQREKLESDIRFMFSRISQRYDLMNRLMTFGRDISWRRFLLKKAKIRKGSRILDVGIGTGDIAFEALKLQPDIHVTGVDFTLEMMVTGCKRGGNRKVCWCQADAGRLPFRNNTFDAVTSGFLARNVVDLLSVFKEQIRVVKPGCMVVCLDTSPVPENILRPLVLLYLKKIIPFLGGLITGEKGVYAYLPESTLQFMKPEALAETMTNAGLRDVAFKRFMFGNISVLWGVKTARHTTSQL